LKESAIGQTVVALIVVLASFSIYHGIKFLFPQSAFLTSVLKSITFTGIAVFVASSIIFERKVSAEASPRGES